MRSASDGDRGPEGHELTEQAGPDDRGPGELLDTVGSTIRSAARRLTSLVVTTYRSWHSDRTLRLGAGLAYYGLFGVVPLLTFSLALIEPIFGSADVQNSIQNGSEALLGSEAEGLAVELSGALADSSVQAGLGVLGGVTTLLAASLVFIALQDAVNSIWHVPVQSGVRSSVRRRLYAFSLVLAFGGLLAMILIVQSAAKVVGWILPAGAEGSGFVVGAVEILGSWAVLALGLVALIHTLTPADAGWRVALVCGATTAVTMTVGTWALGIYIERVGGGSLTGAAGTVLLVLVWIYYEAQILLVGFQLAKVLHQQRAAGEIALEPISA